MNFKKNTKKIIFSLLPLSLVIIIGYLLTENIKNYRLSLEKKGLMYYQKIHNLYYYKENIYYELDETNKRKYIEINGNKYYKIKDGENTFEMIATDFLPYASYFMGLKIIDNKYYIKDIGRGMSNYYGTTLKLKKKSKNKIEYKAITKMCKKESIVSYGEGCTADGYYEIEKPFTIVKEDNKWKVLEYTSVFQFSDRELK